MIGIELTRPFPLSGIPEGAGMFIQVEDNGEPVNGESVDRLYGVFAEAPPTVCPEELPAGFSLYPVNPGNITVRDAP